MKIKFIRIPPSVYTWLPNFNLAQWMILASVMPLNWIQGSLVGDDQRGKARPRAPGR